MRQEEADLTEGSFSAGALEAGVPGIAGPWQGPRYK